MQTSSRMQIELMQIPEILQKKLPELEIRIKGIVENIVSRKVIFCGMGSSLFLSEIGVFFLRKIAGFHDAIAVESSQIEDFYHNISNDFLIIGLSQSGNTIETYNALEFSISQGCQTGSFINNPKSRLSSLGTNFQFNQEIETEKSPVSTKYIAYQICVFYKIAITLGLKSGTITEQQASILDEFLTRLPGFIQSLYLEDYTKFDISPAHMNNTFLFIGDGALNICAKELSLKCRETIGVNSSHDTTGILNHGGINSINEKTICVSLGNIGPLKERIIEKGARVLELSTFLSTKAQIPSVNSDLEIILFIVAGQLLIDFWASELGVNTDIKNW